ncbi:MAG: hypothetical protein H7339_17050 [Arcicella sp.]|nr:hypothetical protein [Arcicella sp.]
MNKNYIYIVCLVIITACNGYSDDFFDFLFNSKGISITMVCSDSPSILSEGRFFEIYSMSDVDTENAVKNIFDTANFNNSSKYPRYKIPKWKKTPVMDEKDSVYSFIHNEIKEDANTCFDENTLRNALKQKRNYYTFLYDNLGRSKVFIWDVSNQKLFLLTSYEL